MREMILWNPLSQVGGGVSCLKGTCAEQEKRSAGVSRSREGAEAHCSEARAMVCSYGYRSVLHQEDAVKYGTTAFNWQMELIFKKKNWLIRFKPVSYCQA